MFRKRKAKREADQALDNLSATAKQVVTKSARTAELWIELVKQVGPSSAVEHVEVSNLMGMVDGLYASVHEGFVDFAIDESRAEDVLRGIDAAVQEFQPMIHDTRRHVVAVSTRHESKAVAIASGTMVDARIRAERLAIAGALTDEADQRGVAAIKAWDEACEAWDLATGRPRLPLVGD